MGRIVEVVERASTTFVGVYYEDDGQAWVLIDGKQFAEPVWLGTPERRGPGPRQGRRRHGPVSDAAPAGRSGHHAGARSPRRAGVDLLTVIHEFGLPHEFPPEVLAEAREKALTIDEENLGEREDLTGETIVTIDPVDARDFDDAISLKRSEDGTGIWECISRTCRTS